MKYFKVRIIIFFLFLSFGTSAQINHFIYLQTENKQPFYVKLDKTLLSSASSGYLIIPKLTDGNYKLIVGFPKNEWPEQIFNCTVSQIDAGYLLKNFGEKGWGLFNLQSLDVNMALNPNETVPANNNDKVDAFSTLLSTVVADPAILKNDAIKKTVDKPAAAGNIVISDIKTTTALQEPQVRSKPVSIIKKIAESEVEGALHLVYFDNSNNTTDSIDIIIPANDAIVEKKVSIVKDNMEVKKVAEIEKNDTQPDKNIEVQKSDVQQNVEKADVVVTKKMEIIKNLPDTLAVKDKPIKKTAKIKAKKPATLKPEKFLPMELGGVATAIDSVTNAANEINVIADNTANKVDKPIVVQSAGIINSDCITNATDDDFLKLRKKMASAAVEEEMMVIAKKVLKQKCFSTGQIKNLAVLFLKDADRYSFFDLAYPFVWDSYNYPLLESQLAEPYFINRFKAMIRH